MPRRVPLPVELSGTAFTYETGRATGLGDGRLRGKDLARPFHGVRSSIPVNLDPHRALLRRCAEFAPLLGERRFFSHVTAARLWGSPLPTAFTVDEPLHVSTLAPGVATRVRGTRGHQARDPRICVVDRHGHPVSDAASTWVALAAILPLDELIVIGDHLVLDPVVLDPRDPRPYVTHAELSARLAGTQGHGAIPARQALGLIRVGSESRPETLLRLLIRRARLPEPEINVDVRRPDGTLLGRGDLVYRQWRTVVEYDGDHHRTNSIQYDRDMYRIENFQRAEWRVVRVRKRGLFVDPRDTIERIRSALSAGGWPG